jgi:hypothetical protein
VFNTNPVIATVGQIQGLLLPIWLGEDYSMRAQLFGGQAGDVLTFNGGIAEITSK